MQQLLKRILMHSGFIVLIPLLCGHAVADEMKQILSKQQICAEAKKGVPAITTAGLKAKIDSGQKFVLLDVRTEAEYRAGYISGAVWLPRGMIELKLQDLLLDPNTEILIYCGKECRGILPQKLLRPWDIQRFQILRAESRGGLPPDTPFTTRWAKYNNCSSVSMTQKKLQITRRCYEDYHNRRYTALSPVPADL